MHFDILKPLSSGQLAVEYPEQLQTFCSNAPLSALIPLFKLALAPEHQAFFSVSQFASIFRAIATPFLAFENRLDEHPNEREAFVALWQKILDTDELAFALHSMGRFSHKRVDGTLKMTSDKHSSTILLRQLGESVCFSPFVGGEHSLHLVLKARATPARPFEHFFLHATLDLLGVASVLGIPLGVPFFDVYLAGSSELECSFAREKSELCASCDISVLAAIRPFVTENEHLDCVKQLPSRRLISFFCGTRVPDAADLPSYPWLSRAHFYNALGGSAPFFDRLPDVHGPFLWKHFLPILKYQKSQFYEEVALYVKHVTSIHETFNLTVAEVCDKDSPLFKDRRLAFDYFQPELFEAINGFHDNDLLLVDYTTIHPSAQKKQALNKLIDFIKSELGPSPNHGVENIEALYIYLAQEFKQPFGNHPEFLGVRLAAIVRRKTVLYKKWHADFIDPTPTIDPVNAEVVPDTSEKTFTLYTEVAYETAKAAANNDESKPSTQFFKKETKNLSASKTFSKMSAFRAGLEQLSLRFPHFKDTIANFETHAILQDLGDDMFYLPPFLLLGGAGVGKTFFLSQVANLVATEFQMISMQSISANFMLTGSSSTWGGSAPGIFFDTMIKAKNINPLFVLDEVDKCGGGSRYSVENSLLTVLERHSASHFKDECIGMPIDMSHAVFAATANRLDSISAPIQSRFEIFRIPPPSFQDRKQLAKEIYRVILKTNAWGQKFKPDVSDATADALANIMADGSGSARDLRKIVVGACAKAAFASRDEIHLEDLPLKNNKPRPIWDIDFAK
jgi:ATP-dependent Lon protease